MAILVIVLGAILVAAGLGGLFASINLVPTEMGLLYAVCGVIAISSGFIVLAIAALIGCIPRSPSHPSAFTTPTPNFESTSAKAIRSQADSAAMPTEMVALPSEPHAAPEAPSAPELQRQVVGRYSAGSANYVVFADGGIEAETKEGAFRFASMGEFKTFIAKRNG